jgi:hypothetical protein
MPAVKCPKDDKIEGWEASEKNRTGGGANALAGRNVDEGQNGQEGQ